jgi:hypothetical protein
MKKVSELSGNNSVGVSSSAVDAHREGREGKRHKSTAFLQLFAADHSTGKPWLGYAANN